MSIPSGELSKKRLKKALTVFILVAGVAAACSIGLQLGPELWHVYYQPKPVPPRRPGIEPEAVILTQPFNPSTSMALSWRTSTAVTDGTVQLARIVDGKPGEPLEKRAKTTALTLSGPEDKVQCHSAHLTDLSPGATYQYRVGSPSRGTWSEYRLFTTAPQSPDAFAFIYLGDTQAKPHKVGAMLEAADRRHPEAAFYMIGGDLVNTGYDPGQWDSFVANTEKVFSRKPIAPAMGNHDFLGGSIGPRMFNAYFPLPNREGKKADETSNYSFRYGRAAFIVVNLLDVGGQTQWLARELRTASEEECDFIVVMFHQPVYNPFKNRTNIPAQQQWVPLFDRYGVDLVLSGHDHSYMRSKRLKAGRPAADDESGAVYVVATGCEKFYEFETLDIAERQFTNAATYQHIVMEKTTGGLSAIRYRSYDSGGTVMDEFELLKRWSLFPHRSGVSKREWPRLSAGNRHGNLRRL